MIVMIGGGLVEDIECKAAKRSFQEIDILDYWLIHPSERDIILRRVDMGY